MKHIWKRALASILVLAMLLATMPLTLAASTPEIKVGNATVNVGSGDATVVVPIEIINNPGIAAIEFSVKIPSGWTISNIVTRRTRDEWGIFSQLNEYGEKEQLGFFTPNEGNGKIAWSHQDKTTADGTMFWVTYSVPQRAVNGDVDISISEAYITDGTNQGKTDLTSNFTFTPGTVTVSGGIDPNTLKPTITTQPVSATYTYPTTTADALSVTATAPMDGTLSYQWYQVGTTDTTISAAQTASFTPSLEQYGTQQYYCRITNTVNGGTYTIDTNRVSITWQRAALPVLTLTPTTYTYDGIVKTPRASVGSLAKDTDYSLSGTQSETTVGGPYTVTATGTGNYTGTRSATWSITPADFMITGSKQMTLYLGGASTAIDTSVLSVQTVDSTTPTLRYTVTQGESFVSFDADTKTLTPLAVGTATLSVSASAANHNNATETIAVTVQAKEDVSGQLNFTKKDGTWSYTGNEMALSTFVNAATYSGQDDNTGRITYRLNGQAATLDSAITHAGSYSITAVYDSATKHGEQTLNVEIGKKTIHFTPVWDYNAETPFTYDDAVKTVSVTAQSIPAGLTAPVYTNNSKKDANTYDATAYFEVVDKANCQLLSPEGQPITGCSYSLSWKILPQPIDFTPSWTGYPEGGFTYDGMAKTITVTGVPETVQISYTDNEKTAANTYTAKASFAAKDTNHTVTQTIDDFAWTINPAKLTLPTAVSGLKFDGTSKTGVPTGSGYTLTDNTGTNAGNYTAKANLTDPANYVWADTGTSVEREIPWTIEQADAQLLTENISLRYSNTASQTLSILSKLQKAGTISNVSVSTADSESILAADASAQDGTVQFALKSGLNVEDANKTATITATFDSTNYKTSTLTINVKVIDKNDVTNNIRFENGGGTYTGAQQEHETATITGFNNANLTYQYHGDRTNVGSFTVTAIYDDADNHGEKTVTYTITPKSLRITGGTVTEKVYDGTLDATVTDASVNGLVTGESLIEGTDFTISNAQFSDKNASAAAKTVTYQLSLASTGTAKNYTLTSTTGSTTGKINKRPITVSVGAIDAQSFTGNALRPQVQLVPNDLVTGEQLRNGTDYTVSYMNNRNVGTADVLVTALSGSNYTFADATGTFTIEKASAPTLQAKQQSYSYADFGSKTIAIPAMPTNAGALGYQVSTSSDVDVQSAAAANGLLSFTLLARDQSAVGSQTTVTVTVSSDNYEDASFTLTVLRADKDTPEPNANNVETTYTGTALTNAALSGSATFNGTTVTGTWSWVTDPQTLIPANETGYTASVRFTPADDIHYAPVEDIITVIVHKALPTGSPDYTPIETSDKTLADAQLSIGSIQPAGGTLAWDADPATVVESGVAYAWTYHPTDSDNYLDLTGQITLYQAPEPYLPILIGILGTLSQQDTFTDVVPTDWYYEAANFAAERGLFDGVGKGRFAPDAPMTRAMLVTVLWRMAGKPVSAAWGSFVDVPADSWYAAAVAWASENGIVTGVSSRSFCPDDPVTREQLAALLHRYAQYLGLNPAAGASALASFVDQSTVDAYARTPLNWAVDAGLIAGLPDNRLAPLGTATRAQVATILMRFIKTYG